MVSPNPVAQPPCCQARRELADKFATAARLYAEAVVVLTGGGGSEAEFEKLRKRARQAQERSEKARAAFEEHVIAHRCGTSAYWESASGA
jgi:hypothetical protein